MCAQWPSATASDYEWGDEWNVLALLFKGRRRPTTHSALRCDALRAQCIGCALRGDLVRAVRRARWFRRSVLSVRAPSIRERTRRRNAADSGCTQ